MKPPLHHLILASASFLRALGDYVTSLAGAMPASPEAAASPSPSSEAPPAAEGEKPKRRGRGPAAPKETVAEPETPAPVGTAIASDVVIAEGEEEITIDTLRALYAPLVRGDKDKGIPPQGQKVKDALKVYDGCESVVSLDPKHYAAFKADIEALLI